MFSTEILIALQGAAAPRMDTSAMFLGYPPAELTFREMADRNPLEIKDFRSRCDISLGATIRRMSQNLLQTPVFSFDNDPACTFVTIIRFLHRRNVLEVTDNVSRAERLARFDFTSVQFLNETDVTALMAPRFDSDGRIERHPGNLVSLR